MCNHSLTNCFCLGMLFLNNLEGGSLQLSLNIKPIQTFFKFWDHLQGPKGPKRTGADQATGTGKLGLKRVIVRKKINNQLKMPKSCGQCHSLNTIRIHRLDSGPGIPNFIPRKIYRVVTQGKILESLGKNHKLSPDFEVLFVFLLSGWLPKILVIFRQSE